MTKHKLYIKVVPQIIKDLNLTLVNCRAVFEINVPKSTFFIWDIVNFNFDHEGNDAMYRIQINTENNTKDIFISEANMQEFTVHFQ